MNHKLDLIIIGGGPAGVTAGIYAARKKLKTVLITGEFGGQSNVSPDVQNWIGIPHISGADLAKNLETHLREYESDSDNDSTLTIIQPALATSVEQVGGGYKVTTNKGDSYEAAALLYAAGSVRRKLPAKGADKYEHKGLTYCATCDGPLFTGRDLVVVGGGDAAFETAAQLLEYAKSVTLMNRTEKLSADMVTIEKVSAHPNMTVLTNADIVEVLGEAMVTGIKYKDVASGEEHTLETGGIFVEIGMIPNTEILKGIDGILDERGRIEIDPWTQQTNAKGLWAAGDCTNIRYHQNGIALGDATKALEDIYAVLRTK
ncbi:MAG: FAD-dependent oxidoreductase [Candidatus Pacebacteria bacterium]|nr:FAD-dependent oxidoreductase [Candidatus Paceibacterota bacterium]